MKSLLSAPRCANVIAPSHIVLLTQLRTGCSSRPRHKAQAERADLLVPSGQEIANSDICCASSQEIANNVASGASSLGTEISAALVMLWERVNGTAICHSGMSVNHGVRICYSQRGLVSVVLHALWYVFGCSRQLGAVWYVFRCGVMSV